MDLKSLTGEALKAALDVDLSSLTAEDLNVTLGARKEAFSTLLALDEASIAQVDDAEALAASVSAAEAEVKERERIAKDAGDRFAALRTKFSADAEDGDDESEDGDDAEDGDDTEEVEAATEDADAEDGDDESDEGEDGETVTAAVNQRTNQTVKASIAKKVGSKVKRPSVAAAAPVTITAAADIPNVPMGTPLEGMGAVATAFQSRVGGFAPYNAAAAAAVHRNSGGQPVLTKVPVASFGVQFEHAGSKVAGNGDYDAMKEAVKAHKERQVAAMQAALAGKPLTAAGWCSPSEVVYNWIADYVVDGLLDLPEIGAPRGGLLLTEGPQLAQGTYANPSTFGWGGTETQAEAGDFNKVCATIECPEFFDHRLDYDGYCWKIPILTEATFPELVADALRLTDVLYAHRMNIRFINDLLANSTAVNAVNAFGGTQIDTLESLTQVAIKERRWWNIGENAVMEVKLPQEARDIFKFDMARRSGLALNDIATDQKIAAHFANHNLSVTYLSDFDQRYGAATPQADWPETIRAIMYPSGTFVKATKDVINLSAVYDSASLSENEYMGVFFEQGVKVIKRGYRSHVVEIPVCTAGTTGANAFECPPFAGSF